MKNKHTIIASFIGAVAILGTTAVTGLKYISNTSIVYSMIQAHVLPNATLTPGAVNPDINQNNISQTICNKNWSTKSIRPPSSYTTALKTKQIKQYGYQDNTLGHFEEDHLISLEIGGDPKDPRNLWPEEYTNSFGGRNLGAKEKDSVENFLHKEVCEGKITLAEAQKEVSINWVSTYDLISKVETLQGIDNNDQ